MKKNKEKLFSVTLKDCLVQPYKGSGKGGQHRNKKETAIRIFHPPSGAEGRCENFREQVRNKKEAFRRMAQSKKFQLWLKLESSRKMGTIVSIEKQVDHEMKNVKIEVKDSLGKWVEIK